jgi:hypothetical protein
MSRIKSIDESPDTGKMVLLYGETGVGKTTSIFQTAPLPMLYISTEPRNPKISLRASGRAYEPGQISLYEYEDWMDLTDMLAMNKEINKFQTVVVDSLSYLMNVRLSNEIEDEIFDAKDESDKAIKTIISSSKMSQEGFGGLASQMARLIKLLGGLTKHGTDVILTALLAEHPKWDRELAAGPALKGKEFPSNLPGSCDLIGYVRARAKDGKKAFPPVVYFEAENDEYLCKFTGVRPEVEIVKVPLDLSLILGRKKKGE